MLPTPGIKPIQLLTIMNMKIVTTHGKYLRASLPATPSLSPYRYSSIISMKFCQRPGTDFMPLVASSANTIITISTTIVVRTEFVSHPPTKIGSPLSATCGLGALRDGTKIPMSNNRIEPTQIAYLRGLRRTRRSAPRYPRTAVPLPRSTMLWSPCVVFSCAASCMGTMLAYPFGKWTVYNLPVRASAALRTSRVDFFSCIFSNYVVISLCGRNLLDDLLHLL